MSLPRTMMAFLSFAGAMGVGLLLAPASEAGVQDAKAPMITVSGTAVNPDGTPGANLAVALKAPDKKPVGGQGAGGSPPGLQAQGDAGKAKGKAQEPMKVLAKGTTDTQGKFSIKFQPSMPSDSSVILEIGDSTKTAWARQPVAIAGKDVDVGTVTLKAAVAR